MKLSVIIIVKNEEKNIGACLESVKWADEIIVVDTGSSDGTVDICRKYTDKIYDSKWLGFGPLKNFAMDKTSGDWILNIDADEIVSSELKDEIKEILEIPPDKEGYYIPFRNYFLGRAMRFGGLGREKHLRFFKKSSGRFNENAVHEGVVLAGKTGSLRGVVEHRSYADLKEYFRKLNLYTSLAAEEKFKNGERFVFLQLFRIPWEIHYRLFIRLGILDGLRGFIWAVLSAFYVWVKYVKLMELERNVKK